MPGLSRNLHKFLTESSWFPFQLSSVRVSAITLPNSCKAFSILLHTWKYKKAVRFCSLDQMLHWPVNEQSTNCDHGGWEGVVPHSTEMAKTKNFTNISQKTANFWDSTYLKLNIYKTKHSSAYQAPNSSLGSALSWGHQHQSLLKYRTLAFILPNVLANPKAAIFCCPLLILVTLLLDLSS